MIFFKILKKCPKFSFLCVFFAILFLFSVDALSFSDIPRPEQSVGFSVSRSTERGIEGQTTFFSSEYGAIWNTAEAAGGFEFSKDTADFSTLFSYFPERWRFDLDHPWDIQLGFGFLQHCQWQFDLAFEFDLYFNTEFRIISERGFLFAGQWAAGIKITDLYAISGWRGILTDESLAMTIRIEKNWQSGWSAYLRAGTHDFYRYPLFPHPTYIFGTGKKILEGFFSGFRFGGEVQFRMNDQFTTPPLLEGLIFRLVVNYEF